MGNGFDGSPAGFEFFFVLIFLLVVGGIIFVIISSINNYAKNKSAPILTTNAKVVTKRINVTHHDSIDPNTHMSNSTSNTKYYVTFETEAGERIELVLSGKEYGLIVENDSGELIYQGEWFKQFKRNIS